MSFRKFLKIMLFSLFLLSFPALPLLAQGNFEFSFHYSRWSIDLLKGFIEEGISEALENEFKDRFLEDIKEEHPELEEVSYSQEVSFDSSGDNYGLEIRWYPGGIEGAFSLGISVEKTTMKLSLKEVSSSLELSEGSGFWANANGELMLKPLSFHLSFRWDILPSSRLTPYITLGLGAATGSVFEKGEVSYSYSGTLEIPGEEPEEYQDSQKKTIKQIIDELEEEEEEFFLPGFLPFLQLNLGIKGKITENIHLLIDAGVWDGFLIRGSIAFRL